ncbi:MAG: carboxypeptidase regulatory-like domain-containing protein [Candidatus Neomarinimicrobiota bacterium]
MRPTYLAAILLLVSAGWAQQGSISGRVTDAQSGAPLVAANVTVSRARLTIPTGSATDANGNYTVGNLPADAYVVKVSYIGYEPMESQVTLAGGQQVRMDFALELAAIQLETFVVTASRRRERIEDAPAAISVITERTIRRESNTNLGDYLKAVKGVDFTQSGVDSYNLSARGFNTSFSSRLLTLTDGRMANVPSLRLIAYNVIPVSFEDVKQFEVVLGPSSALYGPNAHSGVLNIVTKNPRESVGTTFNIQAGSRKIRKLALRHASSFGPIGLKASVVGLNAQEWEHFNDDEYEGHDPAFLGRPLFTHDGIDIGGTAPEVNSPVLSADMISGEIADNGIDDNGNGWIDEDQSWIGRAFADGIDNRAFRQDGEANSPTITTNMISGEIAGNGIDDNGNGLIDETVDDVGLAYADGIDNDDDGYIDEGIDIGTDDDTERWLDGIDNDGDGETDEADERGDKWLNRFGSYSDNGFGDYMYDQDGNLLFDTNRDGIYGGEGDIDLDFGNLPRWIKDSNDDGIPDFPTFDVRNLRYDLRADYEPNPDFHFSFSHGYAWARNINITGIARYLAD